MALLLHWQLESAGYVKDDAYISLRYARNLSQGMGMVFNPGVRLEGYTNFLWIILTLPAYWLGIDPLSWVKGMGCFFGQVGVVLTWGVARHLSGRPAQGAGPAAVGLSVVVAVVIGLLSWRLPEAGHWLLAGTPALLADNEPVVLALLCALPLVFAPGAAFAWAAAAFFAGSASVILWSQGGLEPTLMACLCSGGTLFAMRVYDRQSDEGATRDAVLAGLLLAGAGLTRPDAHAFALLAGAMGVVDAVRRRRVPRPWVITAAVILIILVPYHAWRVGYFGDLLPNTYYVKAAAGPEVRARGWEFLGTLIGFTWHPAAFVLAPLAVLGRTRLASRGWALALAAFFALYLVKIGRDEMKWFRLYLPVLPLLVALASVAVRDLLAGEVRDRRMGWGLLALGLVGGGLWYGSADLDVLVKSEGLRGWGSVPWLVLGGPALAAAALLGLGWLVGVVAERAGTSARLPLLAVLTAALVVGAGTGVAVRLVEYKADWHGNYVRWSQKSFQAMGAYVQQRSEPGEVIAFQDMGGGPFAGGDLRWIDTIGILNHRVARELAAIGLNPFMRSEKMSLPGGRAEVKAFDKRIRDYVFEQNPRWLAFIAYIGKSGRSKFGKAVRKADRNDDVEALKELFEKRIKGNPHAHGLESTRKFREDYRYVRYWKRNAGYWVVLYERKD